MAIAKEAIERFLTKELPRLPKFRGMGKERSLQMIRDTTGRTPIFKTEPRAHQYEGLAFTSYLRKSLLFYDTRTGKTKIACDWATQMRRACGWQGPGLVIAHSPLGLDEWAMQIPWHSDLSHIVVRGSKDAFVKALEAEPDLIIMTWSGLQEVFAERVPVKGGKAKKNVMRPDASALAAAGECFELVIIDEIHKCANHQSLYFDIAARISAKARFRLGMTGTMANKEPMMLWAQAFLIDGGKTLGSSFYFFQAAFCVRKRAFYREGAFTFEFDKAKLPRLMEAIATISLGCLRSEVQDEFVYLSPVPLRMRGDQLAAYNDAVSAMAAAARMRRENQDEEAKAKAREGTFARLRQISSGYSPFVDDEGVVRYRRFLNNAKREWLRDFLAGAGGIHMVIFHEYQETGRMLSEMLTDMGISHGWIYGKTKGDKASIVADFQAGRSNVLLANTATGGTGINLNAADYLCYFECPCDPITRSQSEARPMAERFGRPLYLDDLLCSTVERKIYQWAKDGKNMQQAFLSGRMNIDDLFESAI